jgi:cephalosporin-C deacetylase-like acetyl esterase
MNFEEMEQYNIYLHDVKNQLRQHVYDRSLEAFAKGDRNRDAIQDLAALEARKSLMRGKLLESFGGLPSLTTPLQPQITGVISFDEFRVEKIIFESRPSHYVTGNLYIPNGVQAPQGAVLFVCGHFELGKHHPDYQTVCQLLALAGLVVFAIDPIGQGERLSYLDPHSGEALIRGGTAEHEFIGKQCWPLGDGLTRYFLHDIIRAIDYLVSRPEVDPKKIGITGNSGGGLQTSLAMICDDRIAAAAPATFIMNREAYIFAGQAQDAEQIWPGMSSHGFDHEDILLAFVPRPLLVLAVKSDFFPIEGTRATVTRASRFWEMYGKKELLELFEDDSSHKYTVNLASRAAAFFSKHLLGNEMIADKAKVSTIDPNLMWCTASGQVIMDYIQARTVHNENVERVEQLKQQRSNLQQSTRQEAARQWLTEKIYANRSMTELNPRYSEPIVMRDLIAESVLWRSQEGLFNHAFVLRDHAYRDQPLGVTIGLWDGGTNRVTAHADWVRRICQTGRAVMVLNVTGVGALKPNPINPWDLYENFGTLHKLDMDLLWLGDSLAALRTFDVIRAVEMASQLKTVNGQDIGIYTSGRSSIYAQLASALDKRINVLEIENDHGLVGDWVRSRFYNEYDRAGFTLPGMLQYFDLNELKLAAEAI